MCFEIDFGTTKYLGGPSTVSYPPDLVEYKNELLKKSSEEKGIGWVLTKSKIWEHEKEVRLIIDITHEKLDFSNLSISENGVHLFYNFPPTNVTKIIFGVNSQRHEEIKTLRLMQSMNLHPKYEKMIIRTSDLTLDSIPLNEKEIDR